MNLTYETLDTKASRGSEKCYEALRRMLICGRIAPGTRLKEVEWSEKFEIQRAALREALVLLVHDGLLVRRSTGGFFTPLYNEIDIAGIFDTRIVLELGAVRLTCARELPTEAFASVVGICDVMKSCHESEMTSGFAEADFLFHQKLLELSGNPSLTQMFSRSAQLIFAAFPVTEEARRTAEINTIREHCEILGHIQSGDVSQAVSALESHLLVAKAGMLAALK